MASSQDSSSDSSTSSPQHLYDSPNSDVENLLPGVLMSQNPIYAQFFCQIMTMGSQLEFAALRDSAHALLKMLPCDTRTIEKLRNLFATPGEQNKSMDAVFFRAAPSEVNDFPLHIHMIENFKMFV